MIRATIRFLDERLGIAKPVNENLRKVFPDHWSFMLGEITLYSFVIVLVTGVYLTFFFEPSAQEVHYHGAMELYKGEALSAAFASALELSFDVRFGLVARQMHHWSALLFVAAMVAHMFRIFFTGAYRKPREINWVIGLLLLILAIGNGFLGYSLLDDLLSGTGVRVGYSMLLGIPIIGTWAADLFFGGPFPDPAIIPRFFILHVLLLPGAIIGLLSVHLGIVWYQKHTQFPGPDRTEDNVVGSRLFPVYMFKMIGLLFFVIAVIALLGGVAQINPIWKYGPFHSEHVAAAVSSASQPDFYMGWLDGVLRLVPGWETRIAGYYIPNYFWAGLVLPGVVFGAMFAWPFVEPLWTKDKSTHNLLQRPREMPFRTAVGASGIALFLVMLLAASNDVLSTIFHIAPETITIWLRILIFLIPAMVFVITYRICTELKGISVHPAAPGPHHEVEQNKSGGFDFSHGDN